MIYDITMFYREKRFHFGWMFFFTIFLILFKQQFQVMTFMATFNNREEKIIINLYIHIVHITYFRSLVIFGQIVNIHFHFARNSTYLQNFRNWTFCAFKRWRKTMPKHWHELKEGIFYLLCTTIVEYEISIKCFREKMYTEMNFLHVVSDINKLQKRQIGIGNVDFGWYTYETTICHRETRMFFLSTNNLMHKLSERNAGLKHVYLCTFFHNE